MQHRETLNDTVWQLGQNGGEARAVVDKLRELSGILARHGIRLCPILEERGEEVGLVPESPGLEGWLNDPQTPVSLYVDGGEEPGLGAHLKALEKQLKELCSLFSEMEQTGWTAFSSQDGTTLCLWSRRVHRKERHGFETTLLLMAEDSGESFIEASLMDGL